MEIAGGSVGDTVKCSGAAPPLPVTGVKGVLTVSTVRLLNGITVVAVGCACAVPGLKAASQTISASSAARHKVGSALATARERTGRTESDEGGTGLTFD